METRNTQNTPANQLDVLNKKDLTPLCYAVKSDNLEFVKFVVEGKVNLDLGYPTPIRLAIRKGKVEIFKYLLEQKARLDPEEDQQALIDAAEQDTEMLEVLLSLNKFNVNYKNAKGESALSVAVQRGTIKSINLLLDYPGIEITGTFQDGLSIFELSSNGQKIELLMRSQLRFIQYAKNLLQIPNPELWKQYCDDIRHAEDKSKLTDREKNHIKGRMAWQKILAEVRKQNKLYIQEKTVALSLIQKFINLGFKNANINLIDDCLKYILGNSRIVLTFDAGKTLKNGLRAYRPLNIFESNPLNKNYKYIENRKRTEKSILPFLDELTGGEISAYPKYAALSVGKIAPIENYGKSFLVFQPIVKTNALFNATDSLEAKIVYNVNLTTCTWLDIVVLLHQLNDNFLRALATAVLTNKFPDSYNQQYTGKMDSGYIEAMIPSSLNLLDRDTVEHIHIDNQELKLSAKDISVLQNSGLSITNCAGNPYSNICSLVTLAANTKKSYARELLQPMNLNILIQGSSLLHKYIYNANSDDVQPFLCFKFLVDKMHVDINISIQAPNHFCDKMTPIMYCMTHEMNTIRTEMIYYLLQKGANITNRTTYNESLLMIAAMYNHTQFITLLLKKKIDELKNIIIPGDKLLIRIELYSVYMRAIFHNNAIVLNMLFAECKDEWIVSEIWALDHLSEIIVAVADDGAKIFSLEYFASFITQLKESKKVNKLEIALGYLFHETRSMLDVSSNIFTRLCNMGFHTLSDAAIKKWKDAYIGFAKNSLSPQTCKIEIIKDNKRSNDEIVINTVDQPVWGGKKLKTSSVLFKNNQTNTENKNSIPSPTMDILPKINKK